MSNEELKRQIQEILHAELKPIKDALLGTEYQPNGIIKQLSDYENRIIALEEWKKEVVWKIIGVSGTISALTAFAVIIFEIYKNLK